MNNKFTPRISSVYQVEVGVHTGEENGVHLHFLHNFDYFPTPYNTVCGAVVIF